MRSTLVFYLLSFLVSFGASVAGSPPQKLNSQWLLHLIDSQNLKNIPEVLNSLKTHAPRLLENHFLVHSSMSCQGSSYDKPRAVLFTDDAHFTLTFTEEAPGETAFEISEVIPDEKQIRFYDLDFAHGHEGKPYHFTEPEDCLRCHGAATRRAPAKILAGIPGFFSSIYGAFHDEIPLGSYESDRYLRFLTLAQRSKTYSQLIGLPKPSEIKQSYPARTHYQPQTGNETPAYRRFVESAEELNIERFLWMLESHPHIHELKAAVLAALLDCPDIDSFVSQPELLSPHSEEESPRTYEEILSKVRQGITSSFRFNLEMFEENHAANLGLRDWHLPHATRVAKLVRILEPQGHFKLDDWSMENIRLGYAFGEIDGSSIFDRLIPKLVRLFFFEEKAQWRDLMNSPQATPTLQYCESLKETSQKLTRIRK